LVARALLLPALLALPRSLPALQSSNGVAPKTAAPRSGSTARSVRRTPAPPPLRFTSPRGERALTADLETLLRARVRSGDWGVMVVSLTRGDTLFAFEAGRSLVPASTMKLFTAALAFEQLGPYFRFKTEVFRQGEVAPDGTLNGHLYIRGGGDPALSSRFVEGDANAPMRALAQQVQLAGVRRVQGDVLGDDAAFESKPVPDGWLTRYLHASYAARVSALSLNENLLHVVVSPAKATTTVSLQPISAAYRIVNTARTVEGSRGARLTVARTNANTISVKGWIGSRAGPRVYVVVVDDPASFATGAFASALTEGGIPLSGSVRLGKTPEGAIRIASLQSPPLVELATVMNRESINLFAELIFRNVARQADPSGIGTAAMANAVLRDFLLLRVGARPDDVYASDGSGLSTLDRATARSQVQLLSYADRAPWSQEFHRTLAVAGATGNDETLRLRMRATPAQGNLHAKTGTTNSVVALAGYVSALDGEQLAFAFLYNGRDRWHARETIDAMGATLANFAR
jgi:D-alanyl-D-alanine carboxypeptidase/D-alanyl-D-alanine-endopeptidase (penicillin-binding protein 4)